MVKEFARHHMKIEQVKLEEGVSHLLWSRSIKHPPRKIRVRMTKTDEGYVLISKYEGEEVSTEKGDKKTKSEKIKSKVSKLKDKDFYKEMSEKAKENYNNNFSRDVYIKHMKQVIENV